MKTPTKSQTREQIPVNNAINTPEGYSILKKTRKQIYAENYQKNKEKKKEQQRVRYTQKNKQEQERVNNYSQASDYQVLISLKEYTELNSAKHKKWLDFVWTFNDFVSKEGEPLFSNIIEIMRLRELAEILISDYWETAKNEIKRGKSWNSLDQDQKDRLIKYRAREKARREQGITKAVEELENRGKFFEKEIEMAKFHEERGKVNCPCYDCENKKLVKAKIDEKFAEELEGLEAEQVKGKCCVCGKLKELGEEGACKKCKGQLE